MIYTQTLSVTFDPVTEVEEMIVFMHDNPDWQMIPSTGGVSFMTQKTTWSQKEEKKDA